VSAESDAGAISSCAQLDVNSASATSSKKLVECEAATQKHQSIDEDVNDCTAGNDTDITSSSDKHGTVTALTAPQIKVAFIWYCCYSLMHNH